MAISLLGQIEKLITEHGSAAVLKERIELFKDQYVALEARLAALETENSRLSLENAELQQARTKLEANVSVLESQLAERRGARIDSCREDLLLVLAKFSSHVATRKVAELSSTSEQFARYHLGEMEKAGLVHGSYEVGGGSPQWAIAHEGRGYLVRHGLVT